MEKLLSFQKIVPLSYITNDEEFKLFSLEELHQYNMNYIGDKNGGFDQKNILTLKDFKESEFHFRLYSFILSIIHQKHIKRVLFKRLIKYPEQLDYYIQHNNDNIGKKTRESYPQKYFLEEYLTNNESRFSKVYMNQFFSKLDIDTIRDNLKACVPVYAHINNYSKNTTMKKIVHKFNKKQGLEIFLNNYADLFYDFKNNGLHPKYIQLKLIRKLFCISTVLPEQNAGSLNLGKYKRLAKKYTRKSSKFIKNML